MEQERDSHFSIRRTLKFETNPANPLSVSINLDAVLLSL